MHTYIHTHSSDAENVEEDPKYLKCNSTDLVTEITFKPALQENMGCKTGGCDETYPVK